MRCVTRSLLSTKQKVLIPYSRGVLLRRRCFADRLPSSPTRNQPDVQTSPENVQNEFAGHAMSAFKDMRKVIVFLAYGTLIVGTMTVVIFEGAHFWMERKMREGADEDALSWGWNVESWSDAETGGTSPELGFVGRHAVRAAWLSLRYGKYFAASAAISQIGGGPSDEGSLNIVDASLESARVYLEQAMARVRNKHGLVPKDSVGLDLLERHASVMERLGTRNALSKARDEYTDVFHGREGQRLAEARLAVKVGDVSERLGDGDGALSWWARGIALTQDEAYTPSKAHPNFASPPSHSQTVVDTISGKKIGTTSFLTIQPPSKPAAQRTLVAAMLSLSAYYSKNKQLHDAQLIQEHTIRLINVMVPNLEASTSSGRVAHSPGQTLHHMYLLHRKSLLGIHHGEVTFALASGKKSSGASLHTGALMEFLTAASSVEVIAQVLTGQPQSHPDLPSSYLSSKPEPKARISEYIPPPPSSDSPLHRVFRDSPALSAPAGSLLRDSRLAAAEAWDLCGVLYSNIGGADEDVRALECFERALSWVGDDPTESGSLEGMGVKEWRGLWARFVEARGKVLGTSR